MTLRQTWVYACLAVLVAGVPAVGQEDATSQAQRELETIRSRVLAPLLQPVPAGTVQGLLGALRPDGSWPEIDYGNRRRSSWPMSQHLANVATLARAYKSPESDFHGDRKLRGAVLASLDYWLEHDFRNPNWWWNQIGVPRGLAPTLLLMEDELSEAQRQKGLMILGRAKIGMTGQNLVWVTEITALRGLLERDPALVAAAYGRIAQEIRVGQGEGIQADFSFHQHGPCLYSHGYGAAFVADSSRIATQVAETSLAFPPEKVAVLSSLILDGSQWMGRNTTSDFGAEGREISRKGQDVEYLSAAAANMLKLPTGRRQEFEALAARASGRPAPALVGNRHFWRSDLMTHHRADYYTSARMVSRRIANTDQPCNSEGLKSHHVADGCNAILRTGREYEGIFPVWDWQKIPGTTVEQTGELAGSPRRNGERSFVGGVSDGTYGLAAFDFARDELTARKSWVFFDDEYVCLGTAITCRTDNPVVTTLNQCRLEGDVLCGAARRDAGDGPDSRAAQMGRSPSAAPSQKLDHGTHALDSPPWAWHDGIAYVLLQPAQVGLHNDVQRGNWSKINHRYGEEEIVRDVFSLWIDHGSRPENARYAYIVVPGIDPPAVGAYAAEPPVEILRNEPSLQAVWHEKLGIAALAFYQAGSWEIRDGLVVAVDRPCLVLVRQSTGALTISVASPENEQAAVAVEISGRLDGEGVELLEQPTRSRVVFDLPGGMKAGSSVTQTFDRR